MTLCDQSTVVSEPQGLLEAYSHEKRLQMNLPRIALNRRRAFDRRNLWLNIMLLAFAQVCSAAVPAKIGNIKRCRTANPARSLVERSVWVSVCETGSFNFNKELRTTANPEDSAQFDRNRTISGRFLQSMLTTPFVETLRTEKVEIVGVAVSGSVDLSNLTVVPELFILDSRLEASIRATTTVFLHKVSFQGSVVSKALDLTGATFQNSFYLGNEDDGARQTSEPAFPRYDVPHRTIGGLKLEGVHINGDLYIKNATLLDTLFGSNMIVKGHLLLKECSAHQIQLESIEVDKQVNIVGCQIIPSPDADSALDMAFAKVKDGIWLNRSDFHGNIRLADVVVERGIYLYGASLSNVTLRRATVPGIVGMGCNARRGYKAIEFTSWQKGSLLDFGNARLGGISVGTHADTADYEMSWPSTVDLIGANYTAFTASRPITVDREEEIEMPVASYLAFLKTQKPFSLSVYSKLAEVLTVSGHPEKAKRVMYTGKVVQRDVEFGDLKWFDFSGFISWLTSLAFDLTVGYGYKMYRAIYWAVLIVVLGAFVFRKSPESALYRMPYGFAYSFDMLIPIIRLRKRHEDVELRDWRRYYFYGHKIAGYVIATFIAAAVAGLTQ